jgi:hypothetical protein
MARPTDHNSIRKFPYGYSFNHLCESIYSLTDGSSWQFLYLEGYFTLLRYLIEAKKLKMKRASITDWAEIKATLEDRSAEYIR